MRKTLAALALLGLSHTAHAQQPQRHSFTFDAKCKNDSLVTTNTNKNIPMTCDLVMMTFYPQTRHIMVHFLDRHADKNHGYPIAMASDGLEDNQQITDPSVFIPIQRMYLFNKEAPDHPHVVDLGDGNGGCLLESKDDGKYALPQSISCDAWVSGNGTKAHYKLDANLISSPNAIE